MRRSAYRATPPATAPTILPRSRRRPHRPTCRNYSRTIVGVDQNVGRVLAALDTSGVTQNTVVVFASDNGFFLDEHGIGLPPGTSGNKRNAYPELIRIPLLIRYPMLGRSGVVLDPIALNIDLRPDGAEARSFSRPSTMQGKSLVGMLDGSGGAVRDHFLYEYFFETRYEVPTLVAFQGSRWKLIRYRSIRAGLNCSISGPIR